MPSKNIDHDTRWKEIIEHLFEDFVAFFMPDLFEEIDFSRKPEFLKQELYKIIAIPENADKKINDSLVKVYLKNNTEQWILIHIEVQTDHETTFSERMFTYFYRIFDKFKIKEITAIALFVGENVPKDYNQFTNKYFGTEISYKYNAYQVRKQNEKELQKSKNPFAIAVLAALYIIKTKRNFDNRLKLKTALIDFIQKRVKAGNFPKSVIVPLVSFVMNLMRLDEKREILFKNHFYKTLKDKSMITLTDYDREIADVMNLALYGNTFAMMQDKLKKVEEAAMKTKMQTILNLYHQAKMTIEDIASVMVVEVNFVERVIREYNA
ncbi:MAG: hypothetical protein ACPGVB_06775 [Chitinophagales bacterium]